MLIYTLIYAAIWILVPYDLHLQNDCFGFLLIEDTWMLFCIWDYYFAPITGNVNFSMSVYFSW